MATVLSGANQKFNQSILLNLAISRTVDLVGLGAGLLRHRFVPIHQSTGLDRM